MASIMNTTPNPSSKRRGNNLKNPSSKRRGNHTPSNSPSERGRNKSISSPVPLRGITRRVTRGEVRRGGSSYKVLILMSGGVDSSTAAALLQKKGHFVSGVYLKFYEKKHDNMVTWKHDNIGDQCWVEEMRDAARVAAHLNIPFAVWDVTKEYKKRVLKNFYSEYAAGRTPNPDVLCNSEIKFGIGLERALSMGYDYIATGHYARTRPLLPGTGRPSARQRNKCKMGLRAGFDKNKDQSYFLWRLTQRQLARVLFPIGNYTKPQVRKMAKKFGLHNWDKKDSQGVCFLGKIKLREFLSFPPPRGGAPPLGGGNKDGPIVDPAGKLLGRHSGLAQFTIGQRQGIGIGGTGPYYVVDKNTKKNQLVVGKASDLREYSVREIKISNTNWISNKPKRGFKCRARIRYQGELFPVTIHENYAIFDKPVLAVAEGQSIVFYQGDKIVGGGIINKTYVRE